MSYTISNYSKQKADKLGVEIKNSKTKGKKIDVYKENKKIASIGALGYMDYPSYINTKGKTYADKRRKLYKERHSKDCKKKNSPGFYACEILW